MINGLQEVLWTDKKIDKNNTGKQPEYNTRALL